MINAILFLVALILYIVSPKDYDIAIILGDLTIFLIGSFRLLSKTRKSFNVLSFNLIFLLSFFFCTYSYAIFVIGFGIDFSMTIFSFTDFNYITQSISLSTIAITAYFLGYPNPSLKQKNITNLILCTSNKNLKTITRIRIFLAFLVLINTLLFIASGSDRVAITTAAFIPEFYKVVLIIYLILNRTESESHTQNFKEVLNYNKKVIFESGLLCLLYFIVGDRGFPISIVFIYLGVYSFYYKRIEVIQFIVLASIGAIFLFAIRVTRAGDNSFANGGVGAVASATSASLSGQSALLIFSDLMGTSSEMCLGYEYVDKYGLQYPGKILIIPFYPFPLIPSLAARLVWGKVPYDLAASHILNTYIGNRFGYDSSLGNHIVMDIYIHWGVIGVILLFLIFSRVIGFLDNNKYTNIFLGAAYILAISYALYLPRDSIFTLIRPIFYLWFIDKYYKLTIRRKNICKKQLSME